MNNAEMKKSDRTFKSQLIKDEGEAYIVLTEREVVGKVNTYPGNPNRNRWLENRVTLSLDELKVLASKYLVAKPEAEESKPLKDGQRYPVVCLACGFSGERTREELKNDSRCPSCTRWFALEYSLCHSSQQK